MTLLSLLLSLAAAQTTTKNTTTRQSPVSNPLPKQGTNTTIPRNDNPFNDPLTPEYRGNCLSGRLNFDSSRTFALDGIDPMRNIAELDSSRYDWTIDYYKDQVQFTDDGVVLKISKSTDKGNPPAPRLSTTRFMRYGKITTVMKAPAIKGVVTTFITMGPHLPDDLIDLTNTDKQGGDEIDWEIVGGDPENAQSNIFYRGFKEYSVRGGIHPVTNGITEFHKYEIDWKRDKITFSIDDQVVREYLYNGKQADSPETKTRRFFPDRAGKIQIALWSDKNNAWAGGAPDFPPGQNEAQAEYKYVDIQCYDDNDAPVPQWPLYEEPSINPARRDALLNQPRQGVNGKIPATAAPGFRGSISKNGKAIGASNPVSIASMAVLMATVLFLWFN